MNTAIRRVSAKSDTRTAFRISLLMAFILLVAFIIAFPRLRSTIPNVTNDIIGGFYNLYCGVLESPVSLFWYCMDIRPQIYIIYAVLVATLVAFFLYIVTLISPPNESSPDRGRT